MNTDIELYGANTGNSIRAAIALEEAQIPYTARWVDLHTGQHRDPAFVSLNPAGKVPTLIDRTSSPAQVINQSNAIIQYADSKAPGRLSPAQQGPERNKVFDRYFFFVTDIIAPNHAAFFLWQAGMNEAAELINRRMLDQFNLAETFLTGEFMAGDQFSMADISAFTLVSSIRDRLDWKALPRLSRWFDTLQARPAVQRGLKVFAQ